MRYLLLAAVVLAAPVTCSAADIKLQKDDKIIFLGDSITEAGFGKTGYITFIKKELDENHKELGIELINAGVSGNKVPDLLKRLDKDVLDKKPSIVVIYIGINDVWHGLGDPSKGTPKDKFEAGLKEIVEKIKKSGARVVLCTPSVIGEKKHGANKADPQLEEYTEICLKVAKETDARYCDLRKAFLQQLHRNNKENDEKGVYTTDGVHLNEYGNRIVADCILSVLQR